LSDYNSVNDLVPQQNISSPTKKKIPSLPHHPVAHENTMKTRRSTTVPAAESSAQAESRGRRLLIQEEEAEASQAGQPEAVEDGCPAKTSAP